MQIAKNFARQLSANSVVCFYGDLGAGKTTFIKGLASALSGCSPQEVNSPTFVYLNIYEGNRIVFHFDLYRLDSESEFLSMGFEETFCANGICCIEWAEKIESLIPPHAIHVLIQHAPNNSRKITIQAQKGFA